MIIFLLEDRYRLFRLFFHILLGGLCILSPWPVIIWFYFVLVTSLYSVLKPSEERFFRYTGLMVYLVSFEILARISGTSPYIPYEVGKYLLFVLLVVGIITGFRRGITGWIMILLLVPAAFIDESGMRGFKNIVFNLLGPVNLALAVVYFSGRQYTVYELRSVLRLMLLPLVSVLSLVIIKTPDFSDVSFRLGSNFETAGGWGPNQVSTALGLGALISFISWRNRWCVTGYRWLDFLFLILFIIRGLLTMSRGGMIIAMLAMILYLFYESEGTGIVSTQNVFFSRTVKILVFSLLLLFVFNYANRLSEGSLFLRYKGETHGTLSGYKAKTLNIITSNRVQVIKDDIMLWLQYPQFGAGAGASSYLRTTTRNVAPHVELTRLLSEHGLFGMVYGIMFLWIFFKVLIHAGRTPYSPVLVSLMIIAVMTTFHSAMRTFISPLLYGFALLSITPEQETGFTDENDPVYRK